MPKRKDARVISITIYCPIRNKEVTLNPKNYYVSADANDCESCGSHGDVTFYVTKCECNSQHEIQVYDW